MLMKTSEWIVAHLFPDMQDEGQRLACTYGCEIWLYSLISTFGLLLTGVLLQSFLEATLIITVFYIFQKNGGGFHASSHAKCFFVMFFGLLSGLFLTHIPNIQTLFPYAYVFSFIILFALPLRLHPYKQYLLVKKKQLYLRSYLITLSIAVGIVAIGLLEDKSLFRAGCSAVFLSAVSRLFAVEN